MAKLSFHETVRNAHGPTIPQAVKELVETRPGVAHRYMRGRKVERECTYADIYDEMMRRARNFRHLGLEKGDRVAFVLPDIGDFVLSFLGALAAGVVPVPMYPPLSMGKLDTYMGTAKRILRASGAKMLLTDRRMQSVLWSLVDRVDTLESLHTAEVMNQDASHTAEIDLDHIDLDDPAFLQFTSGSTSTPKGVIVTHGSLLANLDGIMNVGLKIDEDDIAVSWLPLYHDMGLIGLVLAPTWFGVPTTYIPTLDFVKQPSLWMETMSRYQGTLSFAPNFAYALSVKRTRDSKLEKLELSQIKALGCGAEPNHPDTLRTFVEYFGQAGLPSDALLPAYGMAEATLAITFHDLQEDLKTDVIDADRYEAEGVAHPVDLTDDTEVRVAEHVSCGKPFPGHEVVVVDEDYQPVPERHVGQILVLGGSVTPGYYKEPEKTAKTFREFGLLTGDLGYIAEGNLYVTGRMKDIIILNGRNYDPHAIEWTVQEVPGIRKGNVVAFSVPGEQSEELVVAAEVKRSVEDREELAETVGRTIREELFLSPGDIALVNRGQLPKTSSGKLQRRKTREQYLDGTLGVEGDRTLGAQGDRITLAKHLAKSAVSQVRHRVRRGAVSVISRINPQWPR